MVTVDELLARTISYQENVWSSPSDEPSVQQVLSHIRDGTYAARVQHLRDLISRGERDEYSDDKKRLPGVTFSGTFNGNRQIRELKAYNTLLAWIPTGPHGPNKRAGFDVLVKGRNVSCWLIPIERPFAQPKTNFSRLRPSQGIRISLRSKPAATSRGLCARF